MDQFFQSTAANPFGFAFTLLIFGVVLLALALVGTLIPLPMIQGLARRRIVKIKNLTSAVGLIGATTVLVSLVVFWLLVFYPAPVS